MQVKSSAGLIGGVAFCIAFTLAIYFGGVAMGFNALSGYSDNSGRFEPEPAVNPGAWYYWQLPASKRTIATQSVVWVLYLAHQVTCWVLLWYAQTKKKEYSGTLGRWHWIMLALNAFFHFAHMVQSYTLYDGTAQSTPESSSQGSVILILTILLVMEFRDRGIFFGWPSKERRRRWGEKVKLGSVPTTLLRKYHGYAFAWGSIYTFWYHPMEGTWGHALGFFHTSIIMLQGSLAFTPIHLNRYWRFIIESWVTIHSGIVAAQTGGVNLWPMFVFGFSWMVVFTQLFGLPFWKKLPYYSRYVPLMAYIGAVIGNYSWIPDSKGRTWVRMQEIIRIPAILYAFALGAYCLLLLIIRVYNRGDDKKEKEAEKVKEKNGLALIVIILGFAVDIVISIAFWISEADKSMDLILLMTVLVAIYILILDVSVFGQALFSGVLHGLIRSPEKEKSKEEKMVPAGEMKKEELDGVGVGENGLEN